MSDTNYAVIYDLHSHTTASDGCLTPEALVHRAVEMRVGTLAITDHDTTAAIAPAREEISRSGLALNLIPGVEISTVWENHEIHIVGLNIDITHPLMCEFLAQQTERRNQRAQQIAERLEKAQIPGALEGAQRLAQGGAVTRGHFARFLVECGKASSMADVFKKYLARGKTGYVPPQWCTIEQAIDVIHHSGGKAVLAHPGRYNLSAKWLKRLVAHLPNTTATRWKSRSASNRPMNAPSWRHLRVSIIYGHHKDLIFISHVRGSNWVVNSGCPQALKASGSYGNSRRTPQRGNYEPVFLYSS
ncbi:putative phosphoesterase [Escherichia coli]|nr:putative phosphoesterase [Escherichia coli]